MATIWTDAEVMRYMPRSTDPPEVRARSTLTFFTELRSRRQIGAWFVTDKAGGRFLGHCMLAHRESFGEPELGYALGREFWGQGYATEAARALVRYGFEQGGLKRMFAVVFPENEPSWRILLRLGFRYEKDVTHYKLPLAYYGLPRERFATGSAHYRLVEASPGRDLRGSPR